MERIVSFPRIGEYTELFKEILEDLGLKIILPPETSEKTIKFGCKHSSDMMCYPFKVTLGNFWEALEKGANTLVMWDSKGQCRFRHYHTLQEYTLRNLGYKFEMYPISVGFIFSLKKINPKLSIFKILKIIRKGFRKMKEIEKKNKLVKDKINIGIIGEIYTCLEPGVNYNIINKMKKQGVNVYNTVTMYDFLKESIKGALKIKNYVGKRKYKRKAMRYLNGPLGGHGFENIYNLLWLADHKIDGVIHLLPLSCMPETTVETIIDNIAKKKKIPILRFPIDETNSEANVDTRLETFIELVKRRRK